MRDAKVLISLCMMYARDNSNSGNSRSAKWFLHDLFRRFARARSAMQSRCKSHIASTRVSSKVLK